MSYELGSLNPASQSLVRARGVARGPIATRGVAIMGRGVKRPRSRSASLFYSGVTSQSVMRARPMPRYWTPPAQTLSGLEFSLRRPRWLRKLKVGRILGKTLKIGALVAGAAILAPAAAGLGVRAGFGLVKGARALARAGGAVFRIAAGRRAGSGLATFKQMAKQRSFEQAAAPFKAAMETARATAMEQAAATEAERAAAAAAETAAAEPFAVPERREVAMTSGGPMIPDFSDEAPTPTQAGGAALAVGALVVGGLLLAQGRRKGRA